jgi:hypothetical protein
VLREPAGIPAMPPTRFEFVRNLRTAKTLGLANPPGVLAIARRDDRLGSEGQGVDALAASRYSPRRYGQRRKHSTRRACSIRGVLIDP